MSSPGGDPAGTILPLPAACQPYGNYVFSERGPKDSLRPAVVGYLMPARRKLWTKKFWKIRKPTSSGAEVISVAAVTKPQSMP